MTNLKELQAVAEELLEYAENKNEVKEAEAYVSNNRLNIYRLAYHSLIPSNGLEEPKSEDDFGLSLRILFKDGKSGFGSTDSSYTKEAFREAYEKAHEARVNDTDFHSLLAGVKKQKGKNFADSKIMKINEETGITKAYEMLGSAFAEIKKSTFSGGINITGEIDIIASAFCMQNSNGVSAGEENTKAFATLTTSLEAEENATGTSFESSTHISKLDSKSAGKKSAQKAISMQKPKSMESGKYRVLLSESVVAELFYSRFDLALSSIDYNASPFTNRIGEKVGSGQFSVYDDPHIENAIGSKSFTDEGSLTKKTELITNGILKNYFSNDYYSKKKPEWKHFEPLHGFRSGVERSYGSDVGIHGTNIVVKKGQHGKEELIEEVKNGIYIGRLWYTYPINGYANPDYTSTIRADSYIIENGEIVCALTPNSMRVMDNFDNFMKNIIAIGKKPKAILAWGQEEVIITPEIALSEMNLKRISKGVY